jgi:hypothetical protein
LSSNFVKVGLDGLLRSIDDSAPIGGDAHTRDHCRRFVAEQLISGLDEPAS